MKLVITDLDGTFLDERKNYNVEHFKQVKKELDDRNIAFAACTGKQSEKVVEILGDQAYDSWIVGDGGSRIWHQGKFVYKNLIKNKLGLEFIEFLDNLDIDFAIVATTEEATYVADDLTDAQVDRIKKSYSNVTKINDFQQLKADFTKIAIYDQNGKCFDYYQKLDSFKDRLFIVASGKKWIDISNFEANKGTGIIELQRNLNCTKEDTISFGDGYNDLKMFEQSGIKFAMGNAFDDIKEKTDFVVKSNEEDGVLKAIDKLLLI